MTAPTLTVLCVENRDVDAQAAWMKRAKDVAYTAYHVTKALDYQVVSPPEVVDRRTYSQWLIAHAAKLCSHASHMLITQADGRVNNSHLWNPEWLQWDYIGAPWPLRLLAPEFQHRRVGNGGFSLRSVALMRRVAELGDGGMEEEDVRICQHLGDQLEAEGFRFAPLEVAKRFSFESTLEDDPYIMPPDAFGLHHPKFV